MRNMLIGVLCLAFLAPAGLLAEGPNDAPTAKDQASALSPSRTPAATPQNQQPSSVRPNSAAPQQSSTYEREARPRHRRSHISKGEVIFMAGIAGTSMGIGAIAAGGTGLAIGAIVGGWGAYAGHRIWHWVNR